MTIAEHDELTQEFIDETLARFATLIEGIIELGQREAYTIPLGNGQQMVISIQQAESVKNETPEL